MPRLDGGPVETDPRKIWRLFAEHYHLFAGTPTRLWLDHAFETLFGLTERLSAGNADRHYDVDRRGADSGPNSGRARCSSVSTSKSIATTESALDDLQLACDDPRSRAGAAASSRPIGPDSVVDPHFPGFRDNVAQARRDHRRGYDDLARLSRRASRPPRLLQGASARPRATTAIRARATADLAPGEAAALFARVLARRRLGRGRRTVPRADADRDGGDEPRRRARHADPSGLLAQPQSARASRASAATRARTFRPGPTTSRALKPLLDRFGNEKTLTIILFTLDETTYSRELAPLAGHYPALRLGPPWWFFDSVARHAALPRADDRDGGLLQHRRLQRRHARLSLDSRAPRRRAPRRLRVSSPNSSPPISSRRTRRARLRACARLRSRQIAPIASEPSIRTNREDVMEKQLDLTRRDFHGRRALGLIGAGGARQARARAQMARRNRRSRSTSSTSPAISR